MKIKNIILCIAALSFYFTPNSLQSQIPMERILKRVTVPSKNGMRGLVDTVGFPTTGEQMDFIGDLCEKLEKETITSNQEKYGLSEKTSFIGGVSPHDDYIISGRIYPHVMRYIRAKTVILIGNSHWAQSFGVTGKLVFGNFDRWTGPYAPVKISPLRKEILEKLPREDYIINDTMMKTEHSLEALIPFLQYYNRKCEIIPVLIPIMNWESMESLSHSLSSAVKDVITIHKLEPGKDLAVLISTDGVHYGDYGWSYYNYHPFGTDAEGYIKMTELDNILISDFLTGVIRPGKIQTLFTRLVNQANVFDYKITWCGRFSLPFGVNFITALMQIMGMNSPEGMFLRYGTSIAFPTLPVEQFGMGLTGPTNLHHFVSHFALGYK